MKPSIPVIPVPRHQSSFTIPYRSLSLNSKPILLGIAIVTIITEPQPRWKGVELQQDDRSTSAILSFLLLQPCSGHCQTPSAGFLHHQRTDQGQSAVSAACARNMRGSPFYLEALHLIYRRRNRSVARRWSIPWRKGDNFSSPWAAIILLQPHFASETMNPAAAAYGSRCWRSGLENWNNCWKNPSRQRNILRPCLNRAFASLPKSASLFVCASTPALASLVGTLTPKVFLTENFSDSAYRVRKTVGVSMWHVPCAGNQRKVEWRFMYWAPTWNEPNHFCVHLLGLELRALIYYEKFYNPTLYTGDLWTFSFKVFSKTY